MLIHYTTPCPECSKLGLQSTLGFDSDNGKVSCTGETVHEFAEMPGEAPAVAEDTKPELTPHFAEEARGSEPEMTDEEKAALDKAMLEPPRARDFGSQVSEEMPEMHEVTDPEILARFASGAQETAIPNPSASDWAPANCMICYPENGVTGHYCDAHVPAAPCDGVAMGSSPRVGLGEFVDLPNGDALCGVRVSELWVSAMKAEAENRRPAITLAEYLQEIMDAGLLEWHSAVPGVR